MSSRCCRALPAAVMLGSARGSASSKQHTGSPRSSPRRCVDSVPHFMTAQPQHPRCSYCYLCECHCRYRAVTSVSYIDDSLFTSSPVSSAAERHLLTSGGGLAQKGTRSGPRQRSAPAQRQHRKQHGVGSRSLRWLIFHVEYPQKSCSWHSAVNISPA